MLVLVKNVPYGLDFVPISTKQEVMVLKALVKSLQSAVSKLQNNSFRNQRLSLDENVSI